MRVRGDVRVRRDTGADRVTALTLQFAWLVIAYRIHRKGKA